MYLYLYIKNIVIHTYMLHYLISIFYVSQFTSFSTNQEIMT